MVTIALVNLKPGTGKTTSAVWLAHTLAADRARSVILVDADPAASALEWSDLAGGFPFRIMGLPVRDLHKRIRGFAAPGDTVVIDAPQLEDHGGIARSALLAADQVVIPCAPTPIEIARTGPVAREIADTDTLRETPARAAVLLNRTVTRARSTNDARTVLAGLGYDVLTTAVPRLEIYAQSYGGPVNVTGDRIWPAVAAELTERTTQ